MMKILLLAAMDKEISLLLNLLENLTESLLDGGKIYEGSITGNKVFISKCGIGKVNSAINAFRLIENIKPDLVINSGVAGGAGIPVGSVLVADKIAYHDVWCGPGTLIGQADGMPLFMLPEKQIIEISQNAQLSFPVQTGLICSGDKFISKPEEIKEIRHNFPEVKAVDMESASISQVCMMLNIPFAIIRIVSDTPGEGENISQYKDFWTKAPEKSFAVLRTIISELK